MISFQQINNNSGCCFVDASLPRCRVYNLLQLDGEEVEVEEEIENYCSTERDIVGVH